MGDVGSVAAVLLAILAVILVVDLVRFWRADPDAAGAPERIQLLLALGAAAFAGAFFISRGIRGGDSTDPVGAEPKVVVEHRAQAPVTGLAAARLPNLRPQPQARKPPRQRSRGDNSGDSQAPNPTEATSPPVAEEAPTPPATTTTPTPPSAPSSEPTPAPEPPLTFGSSG